MTINIFSKLLDNYKNNICKFLNFINNDLYYDNKNNTCKFIKLKAYYKKIDDIIFNDDEVSLKIASLKYKNINDYICYRVFHNLINKHLIDDIESKPSIHTNIIILVNTMKDYFNLNIHIDHLYNCRIIYHDKNFGNNIKLLDLDDINSFNQIYVDNQFIKPLNIYILTYFYFIKINLINVYDVFKYINDNYCKDLYIYKYHFYYLLDYTEFNLNCLDKIIDIKNDYNYNNDFIGILINYLKEYNKIDIYIFFELYFTLNHKITNKRYNYNKRKFIINNLLILILDNIITHYNDFTSNILKIYNDNKNDIYEYICQFLYDYNKYNYDDLVYIINNNLDIIPFEEKINIIKSTSLSCYHNNFKKMILGDLSEINFKILLYFYLSDTITKYLLDDFICNLEKANHQNKKYVDIFLNKLKEKKLKI